MKKSEVKSNESKKSSTIDIQASLNNSSGKDSIKSTKSDCVVHAGQENSSSTTTNTTPTTTASSNSNKGKKRSPSVSKTQSKCSQKGGVKNETSSSKILGSLSKNLIRNSVATVTVSVTADNAFIGPVLEVNPDEVPKMSISLATIRSNSGLKETLKRTSIGNSTEKENKRKESPIMKKADCKENEQEIKKMLLTDTLVDGSAELIRLKSITQQFREQQHKSNESVKLVPKLNKLEKSERKQIDEHESCCTREPSVSLLSSNGKTNDLKCKTLPPKEASKKKV